MSYDSRKLKRKERELFSSSRSTKPLVQPTSVSQDVSVTNQATTSSDGADPEHQQPLSSNRLLAGCMAYEFLTESTLFGQKFDPDRHKTAPASSALESKKNNRDSQCQQSTGIDSSGKPKRQNYAEVANLLKSDGAHLPGIVNPTQLARWIQM